MRAVIVGSGPDVDYEQLKAMVRPDDLLVIADGGLAHALTAGLRPARVFGDFDSAKPADILQAEQRGWELTRVPREKDETDTELAVNWAREQGATDILLFGATGGRLDHTLANIMTLVALAESGVSAAVIDGRHEVRALSGGELRLAAEPGAYLSLIPLTSEATGVTIGGAKYGLDDATLIRGKTLAVSNEFRGEPVTVQVRNGIVLVVVAKEAAPNP